MLSVDRPVQSVSLSSEAMHSYHPYELVNQRIGDRRGGAVENSPEMNPFFISNAFVVTPAEVLFVCSGC